jgi:hypothetical protein
MVANFTPDSRFKESWNRGAVFKTPPPEPLELSWMPEKESGVRLSFYSHGPVLMTKPLVDALKAAGVSNFDLYPAVVHSANGGVDCADYWAVNIIGVIAAADMEKSSVLDATDGPMTTVIFDSLVIDESKAKGAPFFRLAQSASTILVADAVADRLVAAGGFGLTFTNPEDYCG